MDERAVYTLGAVTGGVLVGVVAGWLVRRALLKQEWRRELRAVASPAGAFLFWLGTVGGILVAVGFAAPETLEPLPGRLLAYLPQVLVAGLTLIAGYALAVGVSVLLGRGLARATGRTRRETSVALRAVVISAAILLSLSQLGVNTTIITMLVGAVALGLVATIALLAGLGGRDLARELAAGRYLRRIVQPGDRIECGALRGEVTAIHPATMELQTEAEGTLHVPHSRMLGRSFQVQRQSAAEEEVGPAERAPATRGAAASAGPGLSSPWAGSGP